MTMDIPRTEIGPDTTKNRTGDGLDTEMTTKTDTTLHTQDTENAETTTTTTYTDQSTPVRARSVTQTKQHGNSSNQTSIHPDSPSSSPTIKTWSISLLRYHILPGRLSIEHIVSHGTLPTKLIEPALESRLPQRIVVREHHNGVMLNRRSRVVAADMVSKTQPWNISCMMRMGRRHIRMKVCITMYVLTGLPENQKRHNPHNNQSAAPTPRDTDNATSSTS